MFTTKDGQKMVGLTCRITSVQLLGKNTNEDNSGNADDKDEFDEYMNNHPDNSNA
jgi:hypothetical protein